LRRNLPLLVLVVVVFGGYLGFVSLTKKDTPPVSFRNDIKVPPQITEDTGSSSISSQNGNKEIKVSPQAIEETNVPNADPKAGELIVWGEIKAVDIDKRVLTIDQQMDDNSIKISPNIPVNKEAIIRTKQSIISLARLKPGDTVGVIVTKDGQARAVLVNY